MYVNKPYSEEMDLRNPKNSDIKREIFQYFGLDAELSYWENLQSV